MMKDYGTYFLLEDSDIGFPRFTTLRRRLHECEELAHDLYEKMCQEFDVKPLELVVGLMLNNSSMISKSQASGGICFHSFYTREPEVFIAANIYLSVTHVKLYPKRTLHETVPHELCHAIHGVVDRESYEKYDHGPEFMDIFNRSKKFYHWIVPGKCFGLRTSEFNQLMIEAKTDLNSFGVA